MIDADAKRTIKWLLIILAVAAGLCLAAVPVYAAPLSLPHLNIGVDEAGNPQEVAQGLQVLLLLTILTLAPAILVMMTSFTRIIVVLSFVRSALGIQQMPPNQILVGLALFLTFFVMMPTAQQVNQQALQPYLSGSINQSEFLAQGMEPIRDFMFRQTRDKDLALFVNLSKLPRPDTYSDIPNHVLIPAFAISELKTAFQIGFVIFVPFLIIDMVVSSALMSMGMLMLPPMMISLPFKILLFVMVDGWNLMVRSLVLSFS